MGLLSSDKISASGSLNGVSVSGSFDGVSVSGSLDGVSVSGSLDGVCSTSGEASVELSGDSTEIKYMYDNLSLVE